MNYVKGLDGLRALAITLVVFHHSHHLTDKDWLHHLSVFGQSGVDLFFIISGYLITTILIQSKTSKNYFKNFYARRFLRIVPLYFSILFISFVIFPLIDHPYLKKFEGIPAWPYFSFLSNYYIAFKGYFQNGLIDLSWTLSIEEQFYIFASLAIRYLETKKIIMIYLAYIILAPVLRLLLHINSVNDVAIHIMGITRFDTLLAGSLLALLPSLSRKPSWYYLSGGICSIVFLFILFQMPKAYGVMLNYSAMGFLYFCICAYVLSRQDQSLTNNFVMTFLENTIIKRIGIYSFGIYLFHNPIQSFLRYAWKHFNIPEVAGMMPQLGFNFVVLLASTVLAGISYHFFELRFLSFKKYFLAPGE